MANQEIEKAVIKILAGSKKGNEIKVLFNPAEYSHEITNKFQETSLPGLANPILQFVNGETQTLSMDLFFDTWTDKKKGNLPDIVNNFTRLLSIDSSLHAPPPVEFKWGGFSFTAVIDKISQKFTMFDSGGKPVRATLNVSFKQYRPLSVQFEDTPLESSDKTKRKVYMADDSLWSIAALEYEEPRYWRVIAKFNRIENPRLLKPGTILLLPPLETISPLEERNGSAQS